MDGELRVPVRQFRQDLRSWLDAAAGGSTVIVERDGRPIAQVLAYGASVASTSTRAAVPAAQPATVPPTSVKVSKAALRETFQDLGERLGGRIELFSEPVGPTDVQSSGSHRSLAWRTAQRVCRDLDMAPPLVVFVEQDGLADDEMLAGFAVPHLHAICLDRHVGELEFGERRAGDLDAGLRRLRHVTAHECFHLFDPSADEVACDSFADGYSGGTRPGVSWRSGPACSQFVSWWGGRGWRGPQSDPTFGM